MTIPPTTTLIGAVSSACSHSVSYQIFKQFDNNPFIAAGILAVQCVDEGLYDMVPQISDWLAVFIIDRLRPWIAHHGGWASLL